MPAPDCIARTWIRSVVAVIETWALAPPSAGGDVPRHASSDAVLSGDAALRTSSAAPVAPARLPLGLAGLRLRLALARRRRSPCARRRRREKGGARERRHAPVSLLLGERVVCVDPTVDRPLVGEVDAVGEHRRGHRLRQAEVTGVGCPLHELVARRERRRCEELGRPWRAPARRPQETEHLLY